LNIIIVNLIIINQVLVKLDHQKSNEDKENHIIIKTCHDIIKITDKRIFFSDLESYQSIICKILPCLNQSTDNSFIRFIPTAVSFTYPITINFQLFDLMLYKNNLHLYVHLNESTNFVIKQEKLVYTIYLYNSPLEMNIFNKYKQFNETIQFKELEWYMYLSVKIVLNYLYLLYVNFHISCLEHPSLTNLAIKINYNRLFGKYYTRYFNNKDNVLPIIANKEYCVHHDMSNIGGYIT